MSHLDRYAQLKMEIAERENELETLKTAVMQDMLDKGVDRVDHSLGSFVLQERRTWKYPADIVEMDAHLKEEKKKAEQIGSATYEAKPVLMFKVK